MAIMSVLRALKKSKCGNILVNLLVFFVHFLYFRLLIAQFSGMCVSFINSIHQCHIILGRTVDLLSKIIIKNKCSIIKTHADTIEYARYDELISIEAES